MIARPTVQEERWLMLADRYPALRAAVEQSGVDGKWKTATLLGRLLGVVLALLGVGMLGGILFRMDAALLVGGLLLLAAAEWMVAQRRVYRSGVEEVLYLCGVCGVVGQLLIWIDGREVSLAVGAMSAAVLLAGWRLLNPVFTTLAMAGFSLAVGMAGSQFFDSDWNNRGAAVFCALLAIGGLVAGMKQRQRPSHDHMCEGLVIVMPWLCCAWLAAYAWMSEARQYLALAVALAFFVAWLVVGVRRRWHAPLIGAMGSLVCMAYALHRVLYWRLHWELIAAGAVVLVAAILIERRLRDRSEGLTSSALDEPVGLDLVQLAAAAHLSPQAGPAPPQPAQGHGGDFAGGGASGRF